MKLDEVTDPKKLNAAMADLQRTYGRRAPSPAKPDPQEQARLASLKATRDAYRNEAQQLVQSYKLDQKDQFFQDVMQKFPGIEKHVDLENIWMFSPAATAERNKGLNPADEWKSYQPLPGRNYTGD